MISKWYYCKVEPQQLSHKMAVHIMLLGGVAKRRGVKVANTVQRSKLLCQLQLHGVGFHG